MLEKFETISQKYHYIKALREYEPRCLPQKINNWQRDYNRSGFVQNL